MIQTAGGGTRLTSHGARSTNRLLSTSTIAPCAAIQPDIAASHSTPWNAMTVIPATWTTAIAGIATRFSTKPAAVTRENADADTGSSTISAASDAATEPATHARGRI